MPDDADQIIEVNPIIEHVYGYRQATRDAWCNYGYALVTIAGSDGDVAAEEMSWLMDHLGVTMGLPSEVLDRVRDFDMRTAGLTHILSHLSSTIAINQSRALVYDASRMSRADGVYADEERQAVKRAAAAVGVTAEAVVLLEALVDLEQAITTTRQQLFGNPSKSGGVSTLLDYRTSPICTERFGFTDLPDDVMYAYNRVLVAVAGSDGDIPSESAEWLASYLGNGEAGPADLFDRRQQLIESGEWMTIDLAAETAQITSRLQVANCLLYDLSRLVRLDDEFSFLEQQNLHTVQNALNIDDFQLNLIGGVIDMESANEKMRHALFQVVAV